MAAIAQDIVIEQGATFQLRVIVKDADGAVVDVTGWTGRGSLKLNAQATTSIADFVVDTTEDPPNGVVMVSMEATETDTIPTSGSKYTSYSKYQYDVELETPDGVVYRILNGIASVSPSITK